MRQQSKQSRVPIVPDVPSLRFVPVGHCVSSRKYHSSIGALEIILQGAFEQAGDLIGVVAERTAAPSSKHDANNRLPTGGSRAGLHARAEFPTNLGPFLLDRFMVWYQSMTLREVTRTVIARVEEVSGCPVVVSEDALLKTLAAAGT